METDSTHDLELTRRAALIGRFVNCWHRLGAMLPNRPKIVRAPFRSDSDSLSVRRCHCSTVYEQQVLEPRQTFDGSALYGILDKEANHCQDAFDK
jgi:hypothetical protein